MYRERPIAERAPPSIEYRSLAHLAETAALLVLAKKVHALWGDEDDDTPGRSGK